MAPLVTISIVTFNSQNEVERCVECLWAQTFDSFDISVWDNGSTDGTAEFLKTVSHPGFSFFSSSKNVGFCAAHNRLIARSDAEFILVLNPDCYLEPDYLARVVAAAKSDERIGAAAGKLYRLAAATTDFAEARASDLLDSAGMYFTPAFRHFDRGSDEADGSRFMREEWVFGVTGAAAFYRRKMLEDIKMGGEYFDEGFFAYREDADLSWRMQSAGWKCLFTPQAVGYHVRRVFASRRSEVEATLKMHSVKNRFLFRLNNVAWQTALRFFLPMLMRDCAVVGYALLFERSSVPGLTFVLRNLRSRWQRRRLIQQKRRVPLSSLHRWIHWHPTAFEKSVPLRGAKIQ
jgi:GT2 family glycosyltransferase